MDTGSWSQVLRSQFCLPSLYYFLLLSLPCPCGASPAANPRPHSPNLLNQLSCLGDDVGSSKADNTSHLHGVPSSPGKDSQKSMVSRTDGKLPPQGIRREKGFPRRDDRSSQTYLKQDRTKVEFGFILGVLLSLI